MAVEYDLMEDSTENEGQVKTGKKQRLLERVLECIKTKVPFWTLSMNGQHLNDASLPH